MPDTVPHLHQIIAEKADEWRKSGYACKDFEAIIATEFAMALEYPDGPFVQNALVFAPGKTIIESLRELAEVPYDKILPPRMHRTFAASVKLIFTRDGEKDIPVIRGSTFNIVVTNTEKIRIAAKRRVRQACGLLPLDGQPQRVEAHRRSRSCGSWAEHRHLPGEHLRHGPYIRGRHRRLQQAQRPHRAPSRDATGQQGDGRLELPEPICLCSRAEA